MSESSPPPFVVFRKPKDTQAPKIEPYDRALELVAVVNEIVGKAVARVYVRDRLDRASTQLVFELGRAARAVEMLRWKNYRVAQSHAADVATVLDILVAQKAAPPDELQRAQALVRELIADIAPRANG